jgi:DNA-binding MarR family transcriptional regulator
MTQVEYLKVIDRHEYITISQLATEVHNSKPTVTELVKKFTAQDCVYKVKCHQDGRKAYLKLTDRGLKIARMEENVLKDLTQKILDRLTQEEVETLIFLFEKLGKTE